MRLDWANHVDLVKQIRRSAQGDAADLTGTDARGLTTVDRRDQEGCHSLGVHKGRAGTDSANSKSRKMVAVFLFWAPAMATFFNEYFGVTRGRGSMTTGLLTYRSSIAFRYSLTPFCCSTARRQKYQKLHADILKYMMFLRDVITAGAINKDLVKAWFLFPEVKQNWLGFSLHGNGGSGLGEDFANSLRANLATLFVDYGWETITSSSHIEKMALVQSGVGRDNISDFTTNLLKDFICKYTEAFAVKHIDPGLAEDGSG